MTPMTVARLRHALRGMPDDAPVMVDVADELRSVVQLKPQHVGQDGKAGAAHQATHTVVLVLAAVDRVASLRELAKDLRRLADVLPDRRDERLWRAEQFERQADELDAARGSEAPPPE